MLYLLFIKVNPEANVCPNFILTLMVNFTLIPLISYLLKLTRKQMFALILT